MDERPDQARFYKRGLHEHTFKYNDERSKVIQLLYYIVFKIQSLAIPGVDTLGTIADICCKLSEESATTAHEVGLSDEEVATPLVKHHTSKSMRGLFRRQSSLDLLHRCTPPKPAWRPS
jgi:hypothetical protein